MKRRPEDMKSSKSPGTKNSPYIGDPRLLFRMRQYIQSHPNHQSFSVSKITEDLQQSFSEYGRKKRNVFQKSVVKVYDVLLKEEQQQRSQGNEKDHASFLEEKYLTKRQKMQAQTKDPDTEGSFSEEEEYATYKDSNSINNVMANLYRNSPLRQDSGTFNTNLSSSNSSFTKENTDCKEKKPSSPSGALFQKILKNNEFTEANLTPERKLERSGNADTVSQESRGSITNCSILFSEATSDALGFIDKSSLNAEDLFLNHTSGDKESPSVQPMEEEQKKDTEKQPRSAKKRRKTGMEVEQKQKAIEVQKSELTFADIGGNNKTIMEICKLLVHMKHPEVYQQLGITPPRGFLLHGPPGCGKTLLAHAIAGELGLPFLKMASTEIVSGVSGESEEKVRDLFEKAVNSSPCILFLDEIDAITPKRETASKDMERRIVSQLLTCMDDLNSKSDCHVVVIGATNRPDSLDPALRRAGRFDREISMGIPDEEARMKILQVLCKSLRLSEDFDYLYLAKNTPGFVGADLMALSREAAMTAVNRVFNDLQSEPVSCLQESDVTMKEPTEDIADTSEGNCALNGAEKPVNDCETDLVKTPLNTVLSWLKDHPPLTQEQLQELSITIDDFKEALKHVQPSAKREGFATIPDVTWDDIGALKDVREELQLAILAPVQHPEQFKALGLTNPPGILLAGPPGCGKTLLAKAIANESGINFISVKGPELLNMYVGESERAVRQVFQRARNSSPCVIFFDELDALCPKRSNAGEGGASVRVVNQLLTEMDGLEERKQVFIMGATNRPDIIDPAILRPGRLDKILFVGLPSVEDREDILKTITKNGTKPLLGEDAVLQNIASDSRCDRFSGADLAALVREASVSALKRFISGEASSTSPVMVQKEHFEAAFNKVKPSVSSKDHMLYEKMKLSATPNL
ncbi:nuclear valosin-containing protein-like [Lingula anatina]|uniref:Nuclear valosin-containing protein-like n=1 Tax=Lingula anatina TaxID=7574 RepID=A0A1S3JHK0_LINAN|nr:nuclear valosin-containing protein-like [Lingula anatina]|eukprot:XP_013409877.1 nuclear valosin-containing protein-like [Lingula anatina]